MTAELTGAGVASLCARALVRETFVREYVQIFVGDLEMAISMYFTFQKSRRLVTLSLLSYLHLQLIV